MEWMIDVGGKRNYEIMIQESGRVNALRKHLLLGSKGWDILVYKKEKKKTFVRRNLASRRVDNK